MSSSCKNIGLEMQLQRKKKGDLLWVFFCFGGGVFCLFLVFVVVVLGFLGLFCFVFSEICYLLPLGGFH